MASVANRIPQLSSRLHEVVRKSDDGIVNVAPWLAHTTLDIIGESKSLFFFSNCIDVAEGISPPAALNYPFNTLDDHQDELTSVYENLL